MDYVNRIALSILYSMITIITVTSVMSFMSVDPIDYNRYLYFLLLNPYFDDYTSTDVNIVIFYKIVLYKWQVDLIELEALNLI